MLIDLITEYNVLQPSPLNEKVLKEKRKKLKETFDRVMRLLQEEEPEHWSEMKRKEVDYEKRRYKRVQYYESVRHAEQVSIEDIPLPSSTNEKPIPATMPKINLPPPVLLTNVPPPSSLRKPDDLLGLIERPKESKEKEPPGIPAMMPPDILNMHELDSDYESEGKDEFNEEEDSSKEETIKDKHDKNIEEFMKEVESAQRKKEEERAAVTTEIKVNPTPDVELEEKSSEIPEENANLPEEAISMPPQQQQQQISIGIPRMPPHAIMFRPPPMRPGLPIGIRMPPGPPPSHLRPPGMPRMGLRMAPGPPPRHKHHHDRNAPPKQTTTTITAKPQIRNLSADVTRFVPTTLRASKRDEPRRVKPKPYIPETRMRPTSAAHQNQQPNKDDAYKQFMEELGDLL